MQSIPFYIAHLLTRHECVIIPDLGAFIVFQADKENNQWDVLSPPENFLEFYPEVNHNDGLLTYSIMKVEKCSSKEANFLISQFVSDVLLSFNQGKTVDIPWVGSLYIDNNKILFRPEKILSCNASNYGLTGFSLPLLTDIQPHTENEEPVEQEEPIEREEPVGLIERDEKEEWEEEEEPIEQKDTNVIPRKKETVQLSSVQDNNKIILYLCAIAVAFLLIIFTPIPLNNGNNTSDPTKYSVIINPSHSDTIDEDSNISEDAIKVQVEQPSKVAKETPVKAIPAQETTSRQETKNQKKADELYYYNIVASLPNINAANSTVAELRKKGFKNADIVFSNSSKYYRVYTDKFDNQATAEKFIIQFRKNNPEFKDAWLWKEKGN